MAFSLKDILRKNIADLVPYSSARDEYSGSAKVFLDANENPYPTGLNRYPDPYQSRVKELLAPIKGVEPSQIFLGNGSDEAIDLIIRATCQPDIDRIAQLTPTYGMYRVCADIQGVETINIPLNQSFDIDIETTLIMASGCKVLFLCTPNNPTGNSLDAESIKQLLTEFKGLVVIDEAYIDFSKSDSMTTLINDHSNLIVLQTLSKAWGLAGIRMGLAISNNEIISVLNKIKYPYNLNQLAIDKACEALSDQASKDQKVNEILEQRDILASELKDLSIVKKIFPSEANFLLVEFEDAKATYGMLLDRDIIVRDRSGVPGLPNCLRITVGTPEENRMLIKTLKEI